MSELPPRAPRLRLNEPAKPKTQSTTGRGYGTRHQKIRAALLAQYPVCQWCEDAFSQHLHHIDHDTKNINPTNLAALCVKCHMSYHAKERQRAD